MRITVKVDPDAARALHAQAPATPQSDDLLARTRRLGVSLAPVHPGSLDETLQSYFHVDVADPAHLHETIEHLKDSPAVEAAYVKPPESLA